MQASLDGSENTKNVPYRAAGGVVSSHWLLCCGFGVEAEGGGVDAVALARRGRSVFEQVSLVGSADGAVYLDAAHEEAAVLLRLYVCIVERPPEARPARAGIVLAVRSEQGRAARDTAVDPLLLVVVVLTAERPLRALHPRDAVLLGGELVLPLFFRLLYLPRRISHAWILPRHSAPTRFSERVLCAEYGGDLAREDAPVSVDEGDVRAGHLAVIALAAELAYGLHYQE